MPFDIVVGSDPGAHAEVTMRLTEQKEQVKLTRA